MRLRLLVVAVVALLATGSSAFARQERVLDERLTSVALAGKVHARVILPAGYAAHPGRRFPVVYFLHGLPAGSTSYRGNAWLVEAMSEVGQAILVIPQGARDSDTDPEYLDWGSGRDWETYVARDLPRFVDAHFRTIRSAAGRAIVGVSAGGYGATVIGLHHPGTFSVVESWSGYFHATDPTGTKALAVARSANVHTLVHDIRTERTWFAFYVGRGDSRFAEENVELDGELDRAGVRHVFELYRGAHQTSLWQAHAKGWLRLAVQHLAR